MANARQNRRSRPAANPTSRDEKQSDTVASSAGEDRLPMAEDTSEFHFNRGKAEERKALDRELRKLTGELEALRREAPRYYFSIESSLTSIRTKSSDAAGPRGARMHVSYGSPSEVGTDQAKYESSWKAPDGGALQPRLANAAALSEQDELTWRNREWGGISGTVLSGADFLLARLDGVLELDGRVTIRAADQTLIDATYWGIVDLEQDWLDPNMRHNRSVPAVSTRAPLEAATSPAYLDFLAGKLHGKLHVNLCVRFETNTGPWASSAEKEDTTWTRPSRLKHERNVWKYRALVRQQFIGWGTITFKKARDGLATPETIALDVHAPSVESWRKP